MLTTKQQSCTLFQSDMWNHILSIFVRIISQYYWYVIAYFFGLKMWQEVKNDSLSPSSAACILSRCLISGFYIWHLAPWHPFPCCKQGVPTLQRDVYPPQQITPYYFLRSQRPSAPLEQLTEWNMDENKKNKQKKKGFPASLTPPAAGAGQWLVTRWAGVLGRLPSRLSSLRAELSWRELRLQTVWRVYIL